MAGIAQVTYLVSAMFVDTIIFLVPLGDAWKALR